MMWLFVLLAVLLFPASGFAQLWAPVLAPSRAADWEALVYTPPNTSSWTQCGATITVGTSTATIQAQHDGCGTSADGGNRYLNFAAGTFDITGVRISKSNFFIKGVPGQTKIRGTGLGCALGPSVICVGTGNMGNFYYQGGGATDPPGGGLTAITAGATQGSTQITVIDASGIEVGDGVYIRQANGTNGSGIPGTNNEAAYLPQIQCALNYPGNACLTRTDRLMLQVNVVTAKAGNVLTLKHPLLYSGWSQSASPEVWYYTGSAEPAGDFIQNVGVENVELIPLWASFHDGGPVSYGLLQFNRVNGAWAKGVTANGCDTGCIFAKESVSVTFMDNYLFHSRGAENHNVSTMYGFVSDSTTGLTIVNNIMQQIQAPVMMNGTLHGVIVAYNFMRNQVAASYPNGYPTPPVTYPYNWHGIWPVHAVSVTNVLVEGNDTNGIILEMNHGSGCCFTLFRNLLSGREPNNGNVVSRFTNPLVLQTYSGRFSNVLGNVMGTAGWHNNYESSAGSHGVFGVTQPGSNLGETSIYMLGSTGAEQNAYDPFVESSLYRFGNYDTVTGDVRWCGTSANTGWAARCGSATEVPSGQFVPASESLPVSFVFSGRPSWFGSAQWPPIGPEVTGGNVAGYGGRAHKIPARVCAELLGMPADGTGAILSFNASVCYTQGVTSRFKRSFGGVRTLGRVRAD